MSTSSLAALAITVLLSSFAFGAPSAFDDREFETALRASKIERIVIYTWSPHMILSQKGLKELRASKMSKGWTVIVAMDPKSDSKLAAQVADKFRWPADYLKKVTSRKLIELGVRNHYPSYLFLSGGKIASPLYPGYKTTVELSNFAARYVK